MSIFKRVRIPSTSLATPVRPDPLALYERYGSVAYNVILQIIPEPDLAQIVLIELFSSSSLQSYTEVPTTGEIIRLARTKALAVRPTSLSAALTSTTNDTMTTAEIVFKLAFCQGYSREAIAEQLNISPANVLEALHTYFKELRSS